MLTVLPIQSKQEQETICVRCGVPYRPDYLAYAAKVDEHLAGVCQFRLDKDGAHLTDFASYTPENGTIDTEALFIMARGCLNFVDLCGVHTAFFDADFPDEAFIHAIGFRKNAQNKWEMNLAGFFEHPCQHKE